LAATAAKRQANRWPTLLDVAAVKFAAQGYHATTIRELATATEMTPGAIYFHVPNKQALLLAVYEEGVQRILDHVETAVARRAVNDHRSGTPDLHGKGGLTHIW
jgi:TetR/AcrR family transcriptional regulator, cholesterol catabolism regulator